jgi:prepilin-type processing-associated H-X9-DG protein
MMAKRRAAFTLVELMAVTSVAAVGACMMAASMQPEGASPAAEGDGGKTPEQISADRAAARQLKDATQIRGIQQSLIIWAHNNADKFPLPSDLDKTDDTVSLNGRAKDTTANILSLLIYNGMLPPEMLVSPAEANASIQKDERYEYTNPRSAIRPATALWDPGFKTDFTKGGTGNTSYAHLQPSDGRLGRWTSTFGSKDPAVSNRAPEITKVERKGSDEAGWNCEATVANKDTLTYLIHGARDSWEGNIGYGDGHVDFVTRLAPEGKLEDSYWGTYTMREGGKALDTYFFDEEDDKDGSNAFLGIFTTAGKSPKDFHAIWD